MQLTLSSQTKTQLERYTAQPVHGLLLVGAQGSGKASVAHYLAKQILQTSESLTTQPYVRLLQPDEKGTIPIEVVRELQRFLRLRVPGEARIRRAVVIEDAGALSTEAQNALLKILEEPPEDTVLILTVADESSLLQTVRSRLQTMPILPPSKDDLLKYFMKTYDDKQVSQAYFLSGGLPGLMTVLLSEQQDHPLFQAVAMAKAALSKDKFEKLLLIDELAKQKQRAGLFCEALSRIAETGLQQAASTNDKARMKQWHKILALAQEALTDLKQSANTKLCLTRLFLQM